jgi:3-hydroxyacyl-CoA dehydrogenase
MHQKLVRGRRRVSDQISSHGNPGPHDIARFNSTDEPDLVEASFCCQRCLRRSVLVVVGIRDDDGHAWCYCAACNFHTEVALNAATVVQRRRPAPMGKASTNRVVERPVVIGIAGSGVIACGLAKAAAEAECPVVVLARSEASAKRVRASVGECALVVRSIDDLECCDVVVEAVVEDMEVKSRVLAQVHDAVADDTLLMTTTSALSVNLLADRSGRPDRFVGLHVFAPVPRMSLIEVIFPGAATAETQDCALELCARLGKTAVVVPDTPGFIVNRVLFPFLFDAVRLLDVDGVTPETLDTCVRLGAAHPMGPLALLDFVGLDVAVAIAGQIGVHVPDRVDRLIGEGRLGRKTGAGFYEYA